MKVAAGIAPGSRIGGQRRADDRVAAHRRSRDHRRRSLRDHRPDEVRAGAAGTARVRGRHQDLDAEADVVAREHVRLVVGSTDRRTTAPVALTPLPGVGEGCAGIAPGARIGSQRRADDRVTAHRRRGDDRGDGRNHHTRREGIRRTHTSAVRCRDLDPERATEIVGGDVVGCTGGVLDRAAVPGLVAALPRNRQVCGRIAPRSRVGGESSADHRVAGDARRPQGPSGPSGLPVRRLPKPARRRRRRHAPSRGPARTRLDRPRRDRRSSRRRPRSAYRSCRGRSAPRA